MFYAIIVAALIGVFILLSWNPAFSYEDYIEQEAKRERRREEKRREKKQRQFAKTQKMTNKTVAYLKRKGLA